MHRLLGDHAHKTTGGAGGVLFFGFFMEFFEDLGCLGFEELEFFGFVEDYEEYQVGDDEAD